MEKCSTGGTKNKASDTALLDRRKSESTKGLEDDKCMERRKTLTTHNEQQRRRK
jgi:hypothetical protein